MPLNLFVPQANSESQGASIKDFVVLILSSEFPLSLNQIHALLLKKYCIQASGQATFKALNDLLEKQVIVKDKKLYSLNKNWIERLKLFVQELEENYEHCEGLPIIESGKNLSLNFNTIAEVDRFILSKLEAFPKHGKKTDSVIFLQHLWWPLFYSFKEYLQLKSISEKVSLIINCKGKTGIDAWCARYYSQLGFKVKLGVKHSHDCDLIVFQDYVIQIFYPAQAVKKIEQTFAKFKTMEQVNIASFYYKIFEKNMKIQVLINKNQELAKQLIN